VTGTSFIFFTRKITCTRRFVQMEPADVKKCNAGAQNKISTIDFSSFINCVK